MSPRPEHFPLPLHVGQLNLPSPAEFREAFEDIFARRFFANHGPLEHELDAALASYLGVRNVVSVVNGTTALMLALRALGVKGEVITPAFTFPATVQAVVWAGLKPVFCDIDPETHMLTPALVAEKITSSTTAILGLHVWGRACAPGELCELAHAHGLKLVFDAAHAIGCTFEGRRIGGFGDAEAFSFHPTKILSGAEGGCIATEDDELATRLRAMRSFHDTKANATGLMRLNAKISEAQAAMALIALRWQGKFTEANRRRYELYRRELAGVAGLRFIEYPAGEQSNFQYVVTSISAAEFGMTRDEVLCVLHEKQILARRYFFPGMHRTPPFVEDAANLPVTDDLCNRLIQLPTGQAVTDEDVVWVCDIIRTAGGERHARP